MYNDLNFLSVFFQGTVASQTIMIEKNLDVATFLNESLFISPQIEENIKIRVKRVGLQFNFCIELIFLRTYSVYQ